MKSLSLVAFMSLLAVCLPSQIVEDEGYVTLRKFFLYIHITFDRKDPDLPFGFWFLGQQDHGMQKRRLGLVNSLLLPKSEERAGLHFGIIRPVSITKKVNTILYLYHFNS